MVHRTSGPQQSKQNQKERLSQFYWDGPDPIPAILATVEVASVRDGLCSALLSLRGEEFEEWLETQALPKPTLRILRPLVTAAVNTDAYVGETLVASAMKDPEFTIFLGWESYLYVRRWQGQMLFRLVEGSYRGEPEALDTPPGAGQIVEMLGLVGGISNWECELKAALSGGTVDRDLPLEQLRRELLDLMRESAEMFKFESRFYDLAPLWLEIARTEYEPLVDNIAPESEPPLTWTPPAHPFDDGPGVLVSPGCSHAPEAIAAVRPVPGLAPYLVTKLCGAFQHMHLLPAGRARAELVDAAFAQAHANRLPIALVLGPEEALYLDPDRRSQQEIPVPFSTLLVSGRLKAAREYPQTDELVARQGRLAAVLKALSGGKEAFVFGDLLKGGRPATSEEITRLSGRGPDGVPRGLVLCPTCGLWNGSCLDPESPIEGALLVRVHCSCENDNACARCGELLAEAKLNSNRYKDDGGIWHYAGFMCLSHECGDV